MSETFVKTDDGVWLIVPAFNEAARLAAALDALCSRYRNVVLVDDGSTDESRQVAARYPVYLLPHLINRGQGAAIRTGLDFALGRGARILVTFDADGQHSVDDIERVAEPVRVGSVDVTLGSRFLGSVEGLPWRRYLLLKLGVLFTRLLSGIRVSDTHNGLRGLSRRAAETIRITEDGYAHASEILDEIRRHDLSYCEVPVHVRYSRATLDKGQTNWNALRIAGRAIVGRFLR